MQHTDRYIHIYIYVYLYHCKMGHILRECDLEFRKNSQLNASPWRARIKSLEWNIIATATRGPALIVQARQIPLCVISASRGIWMAPSKRWTATQGLVFIYLILRSGLISSLIFHFTIGGWRGIVVTVARWRWLEKEELLHLCVLKSNLLSLTYIMERVTEPVGAKEL